MNEEQTPQPVPCEKCEEYLAGWKRALADYDNLKKNVDGERARLRSSMKEEMAKYLVEVVDSLKNILDGKGDPLEGVQRTKKQFNSILERFEIVPIDATGAFDPHLHEAVAQRSELDRDEEAVLEVVQAGWRVGERVIRPAKVIINNKN
ncbi:nucleotide exchange factor GrpE [Candidatus Uhrbacteria bacterium]|nr:nucleotide exchange factor GrpE [Candidatus Uhrbacteria bacterium]